VCRRYAAPEVNLHGGMEAQWKMNMEGKFVDLYKLQGR